MTSRAEDITWEQPKCCSEAHLGLELQNHKVGDTVRELNFRSQGGEGSWACSFLRPLGLSLVVFSKTLEICQNMKCSWRLNQMMDSQDRWKLVAPIFPSLSTVPPTASRRVTGRITDDVFFQHPTELWANWCSDFESHRAFHRPVVFSQGQYTDSARHLRLSGSGTVALSSLSHANED